MAIKEWWRGKKVGSFDFFKFARLSQLILEFDTSLQILFDACFSVFVLNTCLFGLSSGPVMLDCVCLQSFGNSCVSTLLALIAQCLGRWGNGLYSVGFVSPFKSV